MAASSEAPPEPWYLALLGFAEHFRTSSPPKIRLCVHCLQAVFQFKPPPSVEARTHLQLGSVLYRHTKNSELAQTHLEKAVSRAAATASDTGLWYNESLKRIITHTSSVCSFFIHYTRSLYKLMLSVMSDLNVCPVSSTVVHITTSILLLNDLSLHCKL